MEFYSKSLQKSQDTYTDIKQIVPPTSLNELVSELHKIFSSDHVNVEYVKALMSSYSSENNDWKKFAIFDEHRYTRNLVDKGNGKFNLIVLCWNEGQGSSIHDHADAHCFAKILDGELNEVRFDWPDENTELCYMEPKEVFPYKLDETAYINDSMGLHRMENPSYTDRAVSLHLYSPPFEECACFDQRTGHKATCKVTFWSQFGERTPFKPGTVETCGGD